MSSEATLPQPETGLRSFLLKMVDLFSMPVLAILTALLINAVVIFVTSGFNILTVYQAYEGMIEGAFFKQRGLSESLVASIPYVLLSLGLAVGFKGGLFNIGAEGQFYIGAISAAWVGQAFRGLPAIIHLPMALAAGAIGGGIWAGVPGYLKAKTGAHEVITTMMMNYVAFRFTEFIISGPLKDPQASAVQTPRVAPGAELWTLSAIPERIQDPLNALAVALATGLTIFFLVRWLMGFPTFQKRFQGQQQRRFLSIGAALLLALLTFFLLPPLSKIWWPFSDPYDRLHIGLFLAVTAAIFTWWLLWKTTLGFEIRMVGSNANAAQYAGINITRNTVITMFISGALAGLAGTLEVLGVSICRCMQLFFSSGYGFDAIAIALLAKNDPIGILGAAFLFGSMRNGADLMELRSGVSKYIISLIQALVLLFVAAPAIVRWIYRIKTTRGLPEEQTPLTRGWGGG